MRNKHFLSEAEVEKRQARLLEPFKDLSTLGKAKRCLANSKMIVSSWTNLEKVAKMNAFISLLEEHITNERKRFSLKILN